MRWIFILSSVLFCSALYCSQLKGTYLLNENFCKCIATEDTCKAIVVMTSLYLLKNNIDSLTHFYYYSPDFQYTIVF